MCPGSVSRKCLGTTCETVAEGELLHQRDEDDPSAAQQHPDRRRDVHETRHHQKHLAAGEPRAAKEEAAIDWRRVSAVCVGRAETRTDRRSKTAGRPSISSVLTVTGGSASIAAYAKVPGKVRGWARSRRRRLRPLASLEGGVVPGLARAQPLGAEVHRQREQHAEEHEPRLEDLRLERKQAMAAVSRGSATADASLCCCTSCKWIGGPGRPYLESLCHARHGLN